MSNKKQFEVQFHLEETIAFKRTATIEAENWDEVKNIIANGEFDYDSENYDEESHGIEIYRFEKLNK